MNFSQRLKELRAERSLTQAELGSHLNYKPNTISNYETGANVPSLPNLIRLAEFFDVSLDYITGCTDIKTPISRIFSSPDASDLITEILALNHIERVQIMNYMQFLSTSNQYNNQSNSNSEGNKFETPAHSRSNLLNVAQQTIAFEKDSKNKPFD